MFYRKIFSRIKSLWFWNRIRDHRWRRQY